MDAPAFEPDDFCICLDDEWTAMRSLAVEKIEGNRVTVRRDGLPIYPIETEVVSAERLVYNPYRNAARRASGGADATVEQQRQLDHAVLVRVVSANITADRRRSNSSISSSGSPHFCRNCRPTSSTCASAR